MDRLELYWGYHHRRVRSSVRRSAHADHRRGRCHPVAKPAPTASL